MADLTFEIANELLRYDRDTGKLFWRERDRRWFPTDLQWKTWNTRFANKEAFTATNGNIYKVGRILGKKYYAHRIAWLLETGDWPEEEVDHIDGDQQHNRFENLREASSQENKRNQKRHKTNTSGFTGVTWFSSRKKWNAKIMIGNRNHNLGYFDEINDAVAARERANKKHGFHPNHGRAS